MIDDESRAEEHRTRKLDVAIPHGPGDAREVGDNDEGHDLTRDLGSGKVEKIAEDLQVWCLTNL